MKQRRNEEHRPVLYGHCGTCRYCESVQHELVCTNPDSGYCAEHIETVDWCGRWEKTWVR